MSCRFYIYVVRINKYLWGTMMLKKWSEIAEDFTDTLLIGNGASRAISERFDYQSIYSYGVENDELNEECKEIFKLLDTTNFETLMKSISIAIKVCDPLGIDVKPLSVQYNKVRTSLINIITRIHYGLYYDKSKKLQTVPFFIKKFRYVYSLNYDLLLYWSFMLLNNKEKNRGKDLFIDSTFCYDWEERGLQNSIERDGKCTMFFYPHGNLCLVTDQTGIERKVKSGKDSYLVEEVIDEWEKLDSIPLIVSEGDSAEKKQKIDSSKYLSYVYEVFLKKEKRSVVFYGFSFSDRDDHIVKQILLGGVENIAVSMRSKTESEAKKLGIVAKISEYVDKPNVVFFDAESAGCWCYPDSSSENQLSVTLDFHST